MALKISPRLARSHPLGIAAVLGLRWAGRTRSGRRLGMAWYRHRASRVATEFTRLRGVEGVYLTGSARDENAILGYSDIDLMLVTNLPTLEEELSLRRDVVSIVRRHNRPINLFEHLDYVEASDLDLLRYLGNAFAIGFDSRWELLAGRDHRHPGRNPPPRHCELARAAESFRIWVNQSSLLVEPNSHRDKFWHSRTSQRLFKGILLAWLGADRDQSLADLLEQARAQAPGDAFLAVARDPERFTRDVDAPLVRELLIASLEVVDAHLARLTAEFAGHFPPTERAAPVDWPGADDLASRARAAGFPRVEVAGRGNHGDQHLAIVTAARGATPTEAICQLDALLRATGPLPAGVFGGARFPVLLTPALRSAAALMEPFPLVGSRLAAGAAWSRGEDFPSLLAPSREDLETLTTISLVKMFWRPRGRSLRFARKSQATLSSMAREVTEILPELIALRDGHAMASPHPVDGSVLDERTLLELLRRALEELRPPLHAAIEAQRRSAPQSGD